MNRISGMISEARLVLMYSRSGRERQWGRGWILLPYQVWDKLALGWSVTKTDYFVLHIFYIDIIFR